MNSHKCAKYLYYKIGYKVLSLKKTILITISKVREYAPLRAQDFVVAGLAKEVCANNSGPRFVVNRYS